MRRQLCAAALLLCVCPGIQAQGLGSKLKAKVKEKVTQKAEAATESATDSLLNKGVRIAKCAVKDAACQKKASDAGQTVVLTDSKGQTLPASEQPSPAAAAAVNGTAVPAAIAAASSASSASSASPNATPGSGMWLNYDFVPGDRTIFFEDFANDDVGDFPRRLQLKNGNFEVVKFEGKKYLRSLEGGVISIDLPEKLPTRFTVEMHVLEPFEGGPVIFMTTDGSGATWECSSTGGGVYGGMEKAQSRNPVDNPSFAPVDCRFTVDARYIKAYVNDTRVANVPNADVVFSNKLYIQLPPGWNAEKPVLVTDIRIAAGGKKLYDALAANGRVATQGILFDTNSDVIRPESTPTLKEISDMLTEHPDLKLMIEGHTDNVGAAAANLDLSERRAASVRAYLTSHGVDAARLQSKGFGMTKPAAPNTTAEGRQQNRRVELVKIS
jgi:outer membrane protein OmpA-like peptidoglycan-associated protein